MAVGPHSEVTKMITKAIATEILREYDKAHFALNAIIMMTLEHGTSEERVRHEKTASDALRTMYQGIMKPILEHYPELTPEILVERGRKPN